MADVVGAGHSRRPGLGIAVVVAVASASILLVACSGAASPTSPVSPPSVAEPTESLTPSPSDTAAPPEDWTAVMTIGDGTTRMQGGPITYGTLGFLMVGRLWEPGPDVGPGRLHQSLWHSADGLDWEELGLPDQLTGVTIFQLITAADGTYVVYGTRPLQGSVGFDAVALRSSDGRAWEEVETGLPQVIYVQAIERGPAGYLFVGGQAADANPTLWLSADGLTWELVHEFYQTEHWIQIHDADGGAEGYVVLGRRIEPVGNAYQRFAFASADGREWFTRDQPVGPDNQAYVFEANVSSLGPDWVATLGHPDAPTASWFSANGLDWTEVGSLDAAGNTSPGVFEEVDGGLLFSPGSGFAEGVAGVWSSADGANWSTEDFGADIWLGGVAVGDGIVATTGTAPRPDFTSTGGVWVKASD